MDKKLSIIIPVFNAELFIEKCLRSCAEQDIPALAYEIIVINDGSKDNSHQIINNIIKEYSNIIYIEKSNGGVSSARNAGLDIAKGEYVWFIDADDWIESNCLVFLLDTLKKNNLDVLQINAKEVAVNGTVSPIFLINQKASPILSPETYLQKGFFEGYTHMTLSRRSIIEEHNVRFNPAIKMREDLLFYLELITHIQKIQRLQITPYYYCIRESSASILHDTDSTLPFLNEIRKIKKQDVIHDYNQRLISDYVYDHIDQNIFSMSTLIEELKANSYNRIIFTGNSKLKVKIFFTAYNLNLYFALYLFYLIKKNRIFFKKLSLHHKYSLTSQISHSF